MPACWFCAAVALGGVGRQQVPLGRAGAQRARGDHLEARLQQVVPVLDVLRVALADDQRNHRTEGDALGGVGIPVLGHLVGLDQPGDIRLDREVDDVGGLAVDDGPRLVAGGAVGRRHGHALALLGGGERRDDLAPSGFGHRVGDQGQRGLGARPASPPPATSLDPPPHAASRVAVVASAAALSQVLRMFIDDLSLRGL